MADALRISSACTVHPFSTLTDSVVFVESELIDDMELLNSVSGTRFGFLEIFGLDD